MANGLFDTGKAQRFSVSQEQKFIGDRTYNLIIGGTLLYGFVINAIMISAFAGSFDGINPWALLIGYIVCIIIGAMLARSNSGLISFIGYNFIVIPIGVVLTLLIPAYQADTVFNAVLGTGIITLLMMIISSAFPRVFLKMGRTLFITLVAVILMELFGVMVLHRDFILLDFGVILIFSGYVGYDWAKASVYPRTVNNAVDSAIDLYMDIINIFIRLLAVLDRR